MTCFWLMGQGRTNHTTGRNLHLQAHGYPNAGPQQPYPDLTRRSTLRSQSRTLTELRFRTMSTRIPDWTQRSSRMRDAENVSKMRCKNVLTIVIVGH